MSLFYTQQTATLQLHLLVSGLLCGEPCVMTRAAVDMWYRYEDVRTQLTASAQGAAAIFYKLRPIS